MILGTRCTAGLFVLIGAASTLSACVSERSASTNSRPNVAYASSYDSTERLAVYQPVSVPAAPAPVQMASGVEEQLNKIESAAGGPVAAAGIAPLGPEAVLKEAVALNGCDYKERFAEEDKFGYRWGSGSRNRVGLDFGGSESAQASSGRGVKFGYKFTFDAPKRNSNSGC
jgi:hypothetical protein